MRNAFWGRKRLAAVTAVMMAAFVVFELSVTAAEMDASESSTASTGDGLAVLSEPAAGDEPVVLSEPAAGDEPAVLSEPVTGDEPAALSEPVAGDGLAVLSEPAAGDEPVEDVEDKLIETTSYTGLKYVIYRSATRLAGGEPYSNLAASIQTTVDFENPAISVLDAKQDDLRFYNISGWNLWLVKQDGTLQLAPTDNTISYPTDFNTISSKVNNENPPYSTEYGPVILDPVLSAAISYEIPVCDIDGNALAPITFTVENYSQAAFPNTGNWKLIYGGKECVLNSASDVWTNTTNGIGTIGRGFDVSKASIRAYADEPWVLDGISTDGIKNLKLAKMYKLGDGQWTVDDDTTVYQSGVSFYVNEARNYNFTKK